MPDDDVNVNPPPASDPLAQALARLDPTPARLDRDRLMFLAGAESRRSTIRLWQATAGFLAAIGFAAGVLAFTNTPTPFDRTTPAKTIPTSR